MLLSILLFCIILLVYLHIYYHLKVSSELEIYELDDLDKSKLEETCNMRQPVLFNYDNPQLTGVFKHSSLMKDFSIFDVKVRKWEETNNECQHVPLKMSLVNKLFAKKSSDYYSEKNLDFLEESGLVKHIKQNDELLTPPLKMSCNYDIIFGSPNSITPLKYNLYNRNYFYVCDGDIKIKLIAPVFSKHLNIDKDYEMFEFRSPLNVWNIQNAYKENFGKTKVMELKLAKNSIIQIPSYWSYSIQFGENATVLNISYTTIMSAMSTMPQQILHLLQQQNVKRKTIKSITDFEAYIEPPVPVKAVEVVKKVESIATEVETNEVNIIDKTHIVTTPSK